MKIGSAREFWDAYQIGQGSADHTAFEVFAEVVQPLIDYALTQSTEHSILAAALTYIIDDATSYPHCVGKAQQALNAVSSKQEKPSDD